MNRLFLIAALSLSGCSDFMAGYNDARAHRGEPGYSFPERLARVGDALTRSAGDAMVGYANGYAEYQYTHPTIYVQPSYSQPYYQAPQTFHVTRYGLGYNV